MKTILLTILLMVVVILSGCQESETNPKLLDQLIRLDTTKAGKQWKEAFGDDIETKQSFNLMLLNDAYSKFGKRLTALENPDPNIIEQSNADFNDLILRIEALEVADVNEITKATVSCLVHNCKVCNKHTEVEIGVVNSTDPNGGVG